MRMTRRGLAGLLATAALPALAQTYPARPVRIISPFPPGGAVDAVARKMAQRLTEQMGQQFFVENRTGATGTIGMNEAARAAPDGTTLLAVDSTYTMVASVFRSLPWDHAHAFAAISDTAWAPTALVVRSDAPWSSYQAFIDHAKANPEKVTYGSGGIGSVLHLFAAGLEQAAGIRMFHVPYRGAGEAMTGLLSRQVECAVTPTPGPIEHIRSGQLKALALTGPARSAVLPEVPLFAELGLPQFNPVYWTGLAAPAATPAPIIARLQQEVVRAMEAPDMKEFLRAQVAEPGGRSSEDFARLIREETARWRQVATEAHIEPQ
jgi:tripartite-type tricarboxylate transporter receptor subunit TctC